MDKENWKKHALFLCKRGHLETELLLEHYVKTLPQQIKTEETHILFELLNLDDNTLFASLLTSDQPLPSAHHHLQPLIDAIRRKYLMKQE
ncbi:succinate dehydrogenase assembly factor 2 [Thiomicrorhabdus heinhorstiae]|uniref:FAD assembly factor SdhE n=1 Tax=Thiomicrorhabdus heinhorstiae TaxID=2748010 RepID=A0ABS0BT52_9GAMM|nr:succinate dehydrogenase assembly factor 2 [Thiomicrorhabdus heinhorstiae]MBF6056974.1 succinate dehydrogenase assembly factor 2 [Thiomicrorhabdus heinhorstiae]